MTEVAARELRNRTADVLRGVEAGEQVTITSRGRPVAQLTPVPAMRRRPIARAELARRLATLGSTADIDVLAIGAEVAAEWARLRVHLAETGRRVNVNDLWIAATAAAHGLPVVTQDDDFRPLGGARGVEIIRV